MGKKNKSQQVGKEAKAAQPAPKDNSTKGKKLTKGETANQHQQKQQQQKEQKEQEDVVFSDGEEEKEKGEAATAGKGGNIKKKNAPAWFDPDDETEVAQRKKALYSKSTPAWAIPDKRTARKLTKRHRALGDEGQEGDANGDDEEADEEEQIHGDELGNVLRDASPLVRVKNALSGGTSGAGGTSGIKASDAPHVVSTINADRALINDIKFHPSGQLLVSVCPRELFTHHVAGKFVQRNSTVRLPKDFSAAQMELVNGGEDALLVGKEAYVPQLVHLVDGKITPLHFLDIRSGTAYNTSKVDEFIYKCRAFAGEGGGGGDSASLIAAAHQKNVTLASIQQGVVTHRISLPSRVNDVTFLSSPRELALVAGNRVYVYDIRRTAKFLRCFDDEGSISTTCISYSPRQQIVALGSTSGVVNFYDFNPSNVVGAAGAGGVTALKPVKTVKNLNTSVSFVHMGVGADHNGRAVFGSASQKGGFRLLRLPEFTVFPSFPSASVRHDFIRAAAYAPGDVPVFAVAEYGRIVNYAS